MASTKTKTTEKKEPPIFDNSGTSYLAKFINVMEYIYKLFSYYVVGSIKDHKLEFSFILGLIIYIIIVQGDDPVFNGISILGRLLFYSFYLFSS